MGEVGKRQNSKMGQRDRGEGAAGPGVADGLTGLALPGPVPLVQGAAREILSEFKSQ